VGTAQARLLPTHDSHHTDVAENSFKPAKIYSLKPAFGPAVTRRNDDAVQTRIDRIVVAFIAGF
jgi:hypothetical protein